MPSSPDHNIAKKKSSEEKQELRQSSVGLIQTKEVSREPRLYIAKAPSDWRRGDSNESTKRMSREPSKTRY